ncbi:MAG: MarR family transcriptional regulator [Mycobacterium sp.]
MPTSTRNRLADTVWADLTRIVLDNKDTWRRAAVAAAGLPFSRIRILLRLARNPMTVKEVALAATIDAPAATVAVNDLEDRGLVVREVDPNNRRSKLVSLTDAGRALVNTVRAIDDPAPAALAGLADDDLAVLAALVAKIMAAES